MQYRPSRGKKKADRLPVVVRIPASPLGSLKCNPPKGNGRRQKKNKIDFVRALADKRIRVIDGIHFFDAHQSSSWCGWYCGTLVSLIDCRRWFGSPLDRRPAERQRARTKKIFFNAHHLEPSPLSARDLQLKAREMTASGLAGAEEEVDDPDTEAEVSSSEEEYDSRPRGAVGIAALLCR